MITGNERKSTMQGGWAVTGVSFFFETVVVSVVGIERGPWE